MISNKNNNFRIIGLYLFIVIISSFIIIQIFKVQQFDRLINTSSQPKFFKVNAPRGNILSNDGSLLAISMPLYNLFLDLSVIDEFIFQRDIQELSKLLSNLFDNKNHKEYEDFLRTARKSENNRYVRLKLKVDHNDLIALKKFPIFKLGKNRGGLIVERRPNRENPFGLLASRTIGENRDVNPVGIERAYDPILSGEEGKTLKRKISKGLWIPQDSKWNKIPKAGSDVMTTINVDMQDVAERSLELALINENADWGCVVLMEVKTGEIKVIANLKKDSLNRVSEYFNYAMAEHVAPGSTFKLASIVAGIEDGKFDVTDSVDLYKGKFQYYDRVMIDSPHNYSKVTVEKAFVISSNVGISQLIHKNYKDNPSAFTDRIYKMGLSTKLDLELPYPSAIKMPVPNHRGWSGVTLPWMSNGYEMAITPLHLLTFYNAIANNGKMMKPIFTTKIINDGQIISEQHPQVINPAICSRTTITKVIPLLTGVVERGTAKNIKSNKYQIAGKTGTTVLNYAGRKKDEKKKYQASFVGFFPAYNPKYSCIVVVNNPRNENVYGGKVAAPIFKELSDKVYSLDIDIHEPLIADNVIQSTPNVKAGDFDSQEFILNHLEIENLKMASEKEILIEDRIQYDLERLIMPSLIGMNLKDALYLFEKHGLEVEISGSGGVVYQSIKKGDPIKKQTVIKLEFS